MVLVDKAEAARRLGISVDTVERRLKRGDLQGQQERRGNRWRWLVEVPGDGAPAPAPANNGTAPADAPANNGSAPAENGLVAALQEQVKTLTQQLTVKDNQIAELLIVTRQAQAALPAPQAQRRGWLARLFRS